MNNSDLDDILKRARPPEQPADYWDRFSKRVLANPVLRERPARGRDAVSVWKAFRIPNLAMGFGLATAAVAILVFLGPRLFERGSTESFRNQRALAEKQFAGAKKYYEEIAPLFPERLSAIVFDNGGEHLQLSEAPSPPGSVALYLRICGPRGCQRVVTFSGQQIRINGDLCDVLVNHGGEIIVAGRTFWWSSTAGSNPGERYRIEARPLETTG